MSEKKLLARQMNELYLQFCEGAFSRRDLAKRLGALGVSAAAVNMFMRGVPASAQGASPAASPSPAETFEPFTSIKREEWKQQLMAWWAEQDPPYQEPQNQGGQAIMGEIASAFVATTNAMLGDQNPTNAVLALTFETLVGSSPIDGQYVPGLADYWTIDADGRTYTFYLNQNAIWHDGTTLTASDVVFSMDAQSNDATGSSYTASFQSAVESYEAVDDHTVKVVASDVFAQVAFHGNSYVPIVARHVWEGVPFENWASDPGSTGEDLSRVVGTGPFTITEYNPSGNRMVLTRFDNYWDGPAVIDEFVFSAAQDEIALTEQLRAGDVDFVENVQPSDVEDLRADESLEVRVFPTYDFSCYGTNLDPEKSTLFLDVNVRKAMLIALDRQSVVDNILLGYGSVAHGSQPELSIAFAPDRVTTKYNYDPELARQMLADAGWTDQDGDGIVENDGTPFAFELMYNTGSPVADQTVAAFQEMWREVGIEATPNAVDFAQVLVPALTTTFDFDVVFVGFGWDATGDQSAMFHTESYGTSFNFVKYSNPAVDERIDQANRELDAAKRVELLIEANDLINEDLPVAVLWFRQDRDGYNVRLHNFHPNGPGGLLWYIPWLWVDA
jgi:peptide/nickel transport system substrate-binding protein